MTSSEGKRSDLVQADASTTEAPEKVTVQPEQETEEADYSSCGFDGPWFGASYPDAYCVNGYLHDADGDGYIEDDKTEPCPRCNTKEFLEQKFEEGQSTVSSSWGAGIYAKTLTGDDIWRIGKAWARQENAAFADVLIAELEGPSLAPDSNLNFSNEPVSDAVQLKQD